MTMPPLYARIRVVDRHYSWEKYAIGDIGRVVSVDELFDEVYVQFPHIPARQLLLVKEFEILPD